MGMIKITLTIVICIKGLFAMKPMIFLIDGLLDRVVCLALAIFLNS